MTTIGKDYRRNDDNRTIWTPYWLTSAEIDGADIDDDEAGLLWSFPASKYGTSLILIEYAVIQVTTVFAGGTPTLDVGSWTIATEDDGDAGDTITVVDQDEYIPQGSITATSAAAYWPAAGDFLTSKAAGTAVATARLITPADATVPCVAILGAADMASGKARVLMQVVEIPLF
jgi:hypothetical protein